MGEACPVRDNKVDALLLQRVGERVRAARKQQGWSRRLLSENSGVSPRYLAQLEGGEGNISISLLAKVAVALCCDLEDLITSKEHLLEPAGKGARDDQLQYIHTLLQQADTATVARVVELLEQTPALRQQRICLIGLRGAGKSTLGHRAGRELNIPFVELNDTIEQHAGVPVAEIMALYGAEGYRDFEAEALEQVVADHSSVILAAAGGVVSNKQTYQRLLSSFHTIWLQAAPAEHMQRVLAQGDTRPMAGNPAAMEQLKKLLADRTAEYARAATVVNTEGCNIDQSLRALLSAIESLPLTSTASANTSDNPRPA